MAENESAGSAGWEYRNMPLHYMICLRVRMI
jgi:hypothetical protein